MENKKIIHFGESTPEIKNIIQRIKPEKYELYFWEELNSLKKEEVINQASYMMIGAKEIDSNLLMRAKHIDFIQNAGVGYDNIDIEFAKSLNIPVANVPSCNSTSVAELTILFILALYRKLPLLNKSIREGKWLMWDKRTDSFNLRGKKHGILGFGNIGKEVAKLSRAFGTKLYYYDKYKASKDLEEELDITYMEINDLIQEVDILSVHIPLIDETKNLLSMVEFNMMKKNTIVINVSRGGIINENDLYNAIVNNEIAGAALDVWEKEPIDSNNSLLELESVIGTPHVGAGTIDTLENVYQRSFQNIIKFEEEGIPDYIVNDVQVKI